MNIIFEESEILNFRGWLALDLDGLTWQGRYLSEFEDFWESFFSVNLSIEQISLKFKYLNFKLKTGPLQSWFSWLKSKFVIYTFITKDITLYQLSVRSDTTLSTLGNLLRDFFLNKFPQLDDDITSLFQIGNVGSKSLDLKFSNIAKSLNIETSIKGPIDDEIMSSMEVTLYEEWRSILKKMKVDCSNNDLNLESLKRKTKKRRYFSFIIEVVLLITVGIFIVYGIEKVNKWYENYLTNKISIYRPQFLWLDKKLKFKEKETVKVSEIKKSLEEVEHNYRPIVSDRDAEGSEWKTESEVILTSLDTLPRDFDITGLEQSEYEELRKGGYRDTRFGSRKVYRVAITSYHPEVSKKKLNNLLDMFGVKQVDNVRPGQNVPGGIYYNLVVSRKNLREFLAKALEIGEATLFESRTRRANPPGKNKVFIWIKRF